MSYVTKNLIMIMILVAFVLLMVGIIGGTIVQTLDVGLSFWDGFFKPFDTVSLAFQMKIDSYFVY